MTLEPYREEPQPSLSAGNVAKFNWARQDRRPLIQRLTEALDAIDGADNVVTERREETTHGA